MYNRIYLLSLIILVLIVGCGNDNSTNSVKTAKISRIYPASGHEGDSITITGTNFGTIQGTSYVTFNKITKATEIKIWSDNEIILLVPSGATSGKVSVTTNGVRSNELDFTVLPTDSNNNDIVIIGKQVWMKKNLDVSTYRNGASIRYAKSQEEWLSACNKKEGAWCYYNNDPANGAIYGKLYNWYAVNHLRGLAPVGWHVASIEEWSTLEKHLKSNSQYWCNNDSSFIAKSLAAKVHWHWGNDTNTCIIGNNLNANNSTGFSALPGGYRNRYGSFFSQSTSGEWWSSTESFVTNALGISLFYGGTDINKNGYHKFEGLSVRCVRD